MNHKIDRQTETKTDRDGERERETDCFYHSCQPETTCLSDDHTNLQCLSF